MIVGASAVVLGGTAHAPSSTIAIASAAASLACVATSARKVSTRSTGSSAGTAKWDEEFVNSSAVLPDEVVLGLEKKMREEIARRYYE